MIYPWETEPDLMVWNDNISSTGRVPTGLRCAIRRHYELGHLCGYVQPPDGTCRYHKTTQDFSWVSVHGGVTFFDYLPKEIFGRHGKVVGFDCGHGFDLVPLLSTLKQDRDKPYRTFEYVKAEVEYLADQLYNVLH